jgi:putative tryptophan/tyrosine transport system substrate-binding protein
MKRRGFILLLGGAAVVRPLTVIAQQPPHRPLIGVLSPITREAAKRNVDAFHGALQTLGYVEGDNIAVEFRFAGGRLEALAALADELVALRPDIIVVGSNGGVLALKKATQTIPLVVVGMSDDPVALGLVASYARPGGNVTGFHLALTDDLVGKRLALLKEAAPRIARIGVVWNPDEPGLRTIAQSFAKLGASLNLDLRPFPVRAAGQFETAFAGAEQEGVEAFCVLETVLMTANRERIVALVERSQRPAVYGFREFVVSGGLMSLGADLPDQYRRAASYADKILRGAKPGDLPIDQAMRVELVVNLKTAKALGFTIPPSIIARADEVIE